MPACLLLDVSLLGILSSARLSFQMLLHKMGRHMSTQNYFQRPHLLPPLTHAASLVPSFNSGSMKQPLGCPLALPLVPLPFHHSPAVSLAHRGLHLTSFWKLTCQGCQDTASSLQPDLGAWAFQTICCLWPGAPPRWGTHQRAPAAGMPTPRASSVPLPPPRPRDRSRDQGLRALPPGSVVAE